MTESDSNVPITRDSTETALFQTPSKDPWELLDQYAQTLPNYPQTADQIQLTLQVVRFALKADITFWCSRDNPSSAIIEGDNALTREWCHALVERVLNKQQDGDRLWLPVFPHVKTSSSERAFYSIAMVQVSRSRQSWLVALRLNASDSFEQTHVQIMSVARRLLLLHRRTIQTQSKAQSTTFSMIQCFTTTLESRRLSSWGHSNRVARIALCLGEARQLSRSARSDVYLVGLLHDVGLLLLPQEILPPLNGPALSEADQPKAHVVMGDRLIARIRPLKHLRPALFHHHEHFDGSGYPHGLTGESIPLLARILSLADAFDELSQAHPKKQVPAPELSLVLRSGAGRKWDPQLVEQLIQNHEKIFAACRAVDHSHPRVDIDPSLSGTADLNWSHVPGAPKV